MMVKAFGLLLLHLPQILRLIEELRRIHAQAQTEQKVADDIRAIEEAFKKRDAQALNRVFNNLNERRVRDEATRT